MMPNTVLLLFLFLAGCASNPKNEEIHTVHVAGYNLNDEATAWKLTFGILHQHGILAVGYGKGGYVYVSVPPNQTAEARRILRKEILDLSQKEKDSFQKINQ